jgi:hypothetical protein
MKPLHSKLHTYVSLATPHVGALFPDSKIVSTGMWALFKWKKYRPLKVLLTSTCSGYSEGLPCKLCVYILGHKGAGAGGLPGGQGGEDAAVQVVRERHAGALPQGGAALLAQGPVRARLLRPDTGEPPRGTLRVPDYESYCVVTWIRCVIFTGVTTSVIIP